MLLRPKRTLDVLSISALDIFASALGVFILMAILLFPYYLKQPSIEEDLEGAAAALAATRAELLRTQDSNVLSGRSKSDAQSVLSDLQEELATLEARRQAAEVSLEAAQSAVQTAAAQKGKLQESMANLMVANLDLVFVMDATGSMDRELADVSRNLLGIIRILRRFTESLHVGFVAFKDASDAYLTRVYPLKSMTDPQNLAGLQRFVAELEASGGGDPPEPVGRALQEVAKMPWRKDAEGRIIVVGDAPAHRRDAERALQLAASFHNSGPGQGLNRRVEAIFTGHNQPGREFYKKLAETGGGGFVTHRGRIMESVLLSLLRTSPDDPLARVTE